MWCMTFRCCASGIKSWSASPSAPAPAPSGAPSRKRSGPTGRRSTGPVLMQRPDDLMIVNRGCHTTNEYLNDSSNYIKIAVACCCITKNQHLFRALARITHDPTLYGGIRWKWDTKRYHCTARITAEMPCWRIASQAATPGSQGSHVRLKSAWRNTSKNKASGPTDVYNLYIYIATMHVCGGN